VSAPAGITGDGPGGPGDRRQPGPPAVPLAVEVHLLGGTATVILCGDLDLATRPLLAQRMAEVLARKPQRLVFDLARVGFLDCGTARLIAGSAQGLPGHARPVIRSPVPLVRRVLAVTGLDARCEVVS
jgi:anti-anti-sigma factor